MLITRAQLGRLQTAYSQCVRRCLGFDEGREARIAWANARLRLPNDRQVSSFSDLTEQQGRTLIDAAQAELGTRAPLKSHLKKPRRIADSRRAGVDGRRGDTEYTNQPEIVSAELLGTIADYYARLGWQREQFEAWLASRSSPIRPLRTIRTVAQANRVRWALKGMLQAAGHWEDWSKA